MLRRSSRSLPKPAESADDGRGTTPPAIVFLFKEGCMMKVEAYIHSLKDHANNRHVLGEAEIICQLGDNLYLAEYCGSRCTAIFNVFAGRYFVDDVYGICCDERGDL